MSRYRGAVEATLLNLGVRELEHLERLTFADLDRHLRALHLAGRARSTMSGAVAALRSFCEYSALVGVVAKNPALQLRGPSTSYQTEAPYLLAGEAKRLIFGDRPGWLPAEWIQARNRVLIAVSFAAGLRVSEPGRLRLEDTRADEEHGTWSILLRATKWSDQDTRVTIRDERIGRMLGHWVTALRGRHPPALESGALFPGWYGGGVGERQVQRVFAEAIADAEIRPRGRQLSFHILRHTLGTLASDAGWELKAIQKTLRHRDERTTMRYIHTRDARLDRLWRQKSPLTERRRRPGLVADLAQVLSVG